MPRDKKKKPPKERMGSDQSLTKKKRKVDEKGASNEKVEQAASTSSSQIEHGRTFADVISSAPGSRVTSKSSTESKSDPKLPAHTERAPDESGLADTATKDDAPTSSACSSVAPSTTASLAARPQEEHGGARPKDKSSTSRSETSRQQVAERFMNLSPDTLEREERRKNRNKDGDSESRASNLSFPLSGSRNRDDVMQPTFGSQGSDLGFAPLPPKTGSMVISQSPRGSSLQVTDDNTGSRSELHSQITEMQTNLMTMVMNMPQRVHESERESYRKFQLAFSNTIRLISEDKSASKERISTLEKRLSDSQPPDQSDRLDSISAVLARSSHQSTMSSRSTLPLDDDLSNVSIGVQEVGDLRSHQGPSDNPDEDDTRVGREMAAKPASLIETDPILTPTDDTLVSPLASSSGAHAATSQVQTSEHPTPQSVSEPAQDDNDNTSQASAPVTYEIMFAKPSKKKNKDNKNKKHKKDKELSSSRFRTTGVDTLESLENSSYLPKIFKKLKIFARSFSSRSRDSIESHSSSSNNSLNGSQNMCN